MELLLQRLSDNAECMIGALYIDGANECFTLEKPLQFDGQENIHDKTCIPQGRYQVVNQESPKFGQMMPHLVDVPNRDHVMFHWGNTAVDTDGCILLGEVRLSDTMIGESKAAFQAFVPKLEQAWANSEEVWLTVKNPGFVT
jgi:Family of unknown function (DUF5675)